MLVVSRSAALEKLFAVNWARVDNAKLEAVLDVLFEPDFAISYRMMAGCAGSDDAELKSLPGAADDDDPLLAGSSPS
jgi:hypothetical protein